jgi:VIT1/CCC1 family predicted Fe2+/Mn2+ transporter
VAPRDERPITPVPQRPESPDWPTLIARIVNDLARIVQTEIRLFRAGLNPIFSSAIDRLLANTVALAAFMAGGICLLAALVTFLHRWLRWDESLAITGVCSVLLGYVSSRVAKVRVDRSIAQLESFLGHDSGTREDDSR